MLKAEEAFQKHPVGLVFYGFPTTDEIAVSGELKSRNQKNYMGAVGASLAGSVSTLDNQASASGGTYGQNSQCLSIRVD